MLDRWVSDRSGYSCGNQTPLSICKERLMRKLLAVMVVTFFMLAIVVTSGIAQATSADLKMTTTGSQEQGFGTYSGTLKNKGPGQATNVVVTGGIGSGNVSWVTTTQGTCTINGEFITCNIGTMAPNAVVNLSMGGQLP